MIRGRRFLFLFYSLIVGTFLYAQEVVVARWQGAITPVTVEFILDKLKNINYMHDDSTIFILELDTPGGLLESTREIAKSFLNSKTPIVVYVAPSGARAASAGFFLLQAAHVAVMAPGTNTGAAHPVTVGGEENKQSKELKKKIEEDTAAYIRAIAKKRKRNVELAEKVVLESLSFTEEEALDKNLIDFIAKDYLELLKELEKRAESLEFAIFKEATELPRRVVEPTVWQKFLAVISNPNIAYLLLSLGMLGIMVELYNPGAILPGVVGSIALLLSLYSLSVLPINYVALALIFLAFIFFALEIKITSFGLLGTAGVVSFVLGSLMLIRSPDPAMQISKFLIGSITVALVIIGVFLVVIIVRVHTKPVVTGIEGLIGKEGEVIRSITPEEEGKVFVHGEIWFAESSREIEKGKKVKVVAVKGSRVIVEPVEERR